MNRCIQALCNQHTIILYEVPLILWMLFLLRRVLLSSPIKLVNISCLFIIGLLPYLYLPIAAYTNPMPGSWGHVQTLTGFLNHFLRKDYGTFQLFSGAAGRHTEGMVARNIAYIHDLFMEQGTYIAPTLILIALCTRFRLVTWGSSPSIEQDTTTPMKKGKNEKDKQALRLSKMEKEIDVPATVCATEASFTPCVIAFTQAFYFTVFHSLSNLPLDNPLLYGVHQRFWMQPNVLSFVWVGVGFGVLTSFLESKLISRPETHVAMQYVWMIIAVVLVFMQYKKSFFVSDQSDADYFKRYASAILTVLPVNATLLINYDQQWTSIRYMQRCEDYRSDVTAINLSMMTYEWFKYKHQLYPNLVFPGRRHGPRTAGGGTFTLFQFLESNKNIPIYLSGKVTHNDPEFTAHYEVVPVGLVSKLIRIDDVPSALEYMQDVATSIGAVVEFLPTFPSEIKYPEVSWYCNTH